MAARGVNPRRARRKANAKPAMLDAMLASLAGPERRRLLLRLAEGPQDVTTLAGKDRDSVQLVSYRLGLLAENGLVRVTKDGTRRVYRLGDCIRISQRGGRTTVKVASRDRAETVIKLPR